MPQETEIKLKIQNTKSFHRLLKRLGAKPAFPGVSRVHEMNLLFDTPQGGLAKHGQLLRIRTETPQPEKKSRSSKPLPQRVLLTFKSPPEALAIGSPAQSPETSANRRYKIREEIELELPEAAPMQRIFEGLGLRGWFHYEKRRTTYRLPTRLKWAKGLLIEYDETPIGTFVELEGPPNAIDRAARELGYSQKDYVTKNYLVLYLERCRQRGEQPGDMLFCPDDKRSAPAKHLLSA